MKKTLLLLALLAASPLCATTRVSVATDNFNRAGPALGSNWATLNNLSGDDMKIVASLRVTGATSGSSRAAARWVGSGSFTDDQYSGIAITALGFVSSSYSIGVICRAGSGTDSSRNFYEVLVLADSNGPNYTTQVNKVVSGTRTALNSASRSWAVNDRIECEAEGTTIRGLKNGTAFFTTTDSALTTGNPGIAGSNDEVDTNATGDDWDGGNLTAGGTPAPVKQPIIIYGSILIALMALVAPVKRTAGFFIVALLAAASLRGQSTLQTTANAMAPGTWATVSTNGFNNGAVLHPPDGGSLIEFMEQAQWNPIAKKVMIVGGAHPSSPTACGSTKFVEYVDSTNTWDQNLPNPCPNFDTSGLIGSINVGHPYDHQTIDPATGDLYHRQANGFQVMKFSQATQTWSQCSPYNSSGTSTSWVNLNQKQVDGSLVYFPERQSLIFLDGDWGLYELSVASGNCTGSWNLLASGTAGGFSPQLTGVGSLDNEGTWSALCHCVIIGGGSGSRKLWKYSAKGVITAIADAPQVISIPQAGGGSIFVTDPATGKLVMWFYSNAGTTMYEYDPIANTWATITRTAPIFPGPGGGTYNTVAIPISDYNVILFAQTDSPNGSTSIVKLYKHAAPTTDMDFARRCASPGVFMCVPLDASSEIAGAYGDINGTIAGDGGNLPVIDNTTFASGNGSLKCQILTTGGSAKCGDAWFSFVNNITQPGTTRLYFDSGQDFYVQWRQRFSSTYGGSGQFKQTNIGGGDPQGCTSSTSASCTDPFNSGTGAISSCNAAELVTQNTGNRQLAQMYNSCTGSSSHGAFDPFEQPVSTAWNPSNFYFQNATGAPGCYYQQQAGGPLGGYDANRFPPNGSCIGYFPNQWMTFQVHVHLGAFSNGEYPSSHVDMWIAREGQAAQQAFNWGPYALTSSGGGFSHLRYGKVWLTGYDTTGATSLGTTWFDELLVSTTRIPDPGQSAGSPAVSLSSASINFGNQLLTVPTGVQNVTLTNIGTASLSVNSISIGGANPGDFSISGNCTSSLGVGASCVSNITFIPTQPGARVATLSFNTNAASTPDNVTLSGTGLVNVISGKSTVSGNATIKVNP